MLNRFRPKGCSGVIVKFCKDILVFFFGKRGRGEGRGERGEGEGERFCGVEEWEVESVEAMVGAGGI